MPAFSRADYETLLYTLTERYPEVSSSTLRLYTNSATTAFVRGSVLFHNGLELKVFEYLFQAPNLPALIADCIELGKAM